VGLTDLGGWGGVLVALTAGKDLSAAQAEEVLDEVLAGTATDAQIAALLIALKMKGETPEEVDGLVAAMLKHSTPVVAPEGAVDIVGTGGDRSGSVNVSTMASFVVAGAGVPVVKHGNRAISSSVGAADVLEGLGVVIELGPAGVEACLAEAGMGFCFAQRYHPAMRFVGPVRRELATPTIFNILGPLANPARPTRQLVGVADPARARMVADVLGRRGTVRATVVYGDDGMDEVTLTAPSTLLEVHGDGTSATVTEHRLDPRDFGLALVEPSALVGGSLEVNVRAVHEVLSGAAGPHRDIVLLNAAVALIDAGTATDVSQGLEIGAASIDGGSAARVLERLVETSTAFGQS
jgi:anthranilate phosphoribosyltransferase